jgi:MYXO-CTERM domain-containing protein
LERVKTAYDEEVGAEVTSDPTRYVLGIEGAEIRLDAGQIQVFAKNGCILPTGGGVDTGSESVSSDCSYGELFYGSLSFTADSDETLRLYCPSNAGEEILIDEINFNFTELGIREGHSLMFDGARLGAEAASLNDTASNWCEGAFSQQFYEAEEGECSYGSPGTAAPCVTDPLDPPKTVCRCAGVSGDPARALWPLLGLLGILGLRRRS